MGWEGSGGSIRQQVNRKDTMPLGKTVNDFKSINPAADRSTGALGAGMAEAAALLM
jgi:hypothetical protein